MSRAAADTHHQKFMATQFLALLRVKGASHLPSPPDDKAATSEHFRWAIGDAVAENDLESEHSKMGQLLLILRATSGDALSAGVNLSTSGPLCRPSSCT